MMRVYGLNTCGHNVDQLRALIKTAMQRRLPYNLAISWLAEELCCSLTRLNTAQPVTHSLFFLACGASTRFRAMVSPYEDSRSHSLGTPQSVGFLWSSDQPDRETLPHNTQHFTRDQHPCPGGIRTHNSSKRAAAEPCHRPRGHWDRQLLRIITLHAIGTSTVPVRLCRASGWIPQQVHVRFSSTLWPVKTWVDANFYIQVATKWQSVWKEWGKSSAPSVQGQYALASES